MLGVIINSRKQRPLSTVSLRTRNVLEGIDEPRVTSLLGFTAKDHLLIRSIILLWNLY